MAAHVLIMLEVIAVIEKQDIPETIMKKMITTSRDDSCPLGLFLWM